MSATLIPRQTEARLAEISAPVPLDTRIAVREIQAGLDARCDHCEEEIKWEATKKRKYVIANIYEGPAGDRRWDRIEQFHVLCYRWLKQPYGKLPWDAK